MLDFSDFGLNPRDRRARVKRVALAVVAAWRASAQESGLKNTLREYKRGVVIREAGENHAVVALVGELPNLLERGQPPHDMRDYLLSTVRAGAAPIRKVKKGPRKGEPYRYIMFRRKTAEIKKMGGVATYAEARALSASLSGSEGRLIYGGRLPAGRSSHYLNKSGVLSVSDATSGLVRLVGFTTAQAGEGSNTTYAAFRTVSTLRPEAWKHPGLTPLNLAQKLDVEAIAAEAGL